MQRINEKLILGSEHFLTLKSFAEKSCFHVRKFGLFGTISNDRPNLNAKCNITFRSTRENAETNCQGFLHDFASATAAVGH